MKRTAKIAAAIILALIALLNVCTMIFHSLDLGTRLNWFPAALLEVESGSMEPRLSVGDLVVIWETPYEKLQPGDVITFHRGNELVTHELTRWDGSRLVTKGLANSLEDPSIGPEEYCARMLFSVPRGGAILKTLTSPGSLALSILLILFLFYGMPLLKLLWTWIEKKESEKVRFGTLRIAASAAAVSVLALTPFMTAAKYTAQINKYTMAVADASYFTSNYLSKEGTNYNIQGWNGEDYNIGLEIRNYANNLLFNQTGHDLDYTIRLVQVTGGEYKTDYTLKLKKAGNEGPLTGKDGLYPGENSFYKLMGGTAAAADKYTVTIDVAEEGAGKLAFKDKIRFQIIAETSSEKDFYQQLLGDFTFEVAESNAFLGKQSGSNTVGTALVTYSLKTNQVGGHGTHNVKVSWDSSKLYINQYEATIQNLLYSYPDLIKTENGRNYVILPLQAYSSLKLEFFKYDHNAVVHFGEYHDAEGHGHVADIYAIEVKDEPGGPADPTPPADIGSDAHTDAD